MCDSILIGSKEDKNYRLEHQFSKDWDGNLESLKKKSFHCPGLIFHAVFTANPVQDVGFGFFTRNQCALRWSQLFESSLEGRWKHEVNVEKLCR